MRISLLTSKFPDLIIFAWQLLLFVCSVDLKDFTSKNVDFISSFRISSSLHFFNEWIENIKNKSISDVIFSSFKSSSSQIFLNKIFTDSSKEFLINKDIKNDLNFEKAKEWMSLSSRSIHILNMNVNDHASDSISFYILYKVSLRWLYF